MQILCAESKIQKNLLVTSQVSPLQSTPSWAHLVRVLSRHRQCLTSRRRSPPFPPSQVPQMKRTVERFVFRIKLLLAETDQADAFWLGALKHKDLQGHAASSQVRRVAGRAPDDLELQNARAAFSMGDRGVVGKGAGS